MIFSKIMIFLNEIAKLKNNTGVCWYQAVGYMGWCIKTKIKSEHTDKRVTLPRGYSSIQVYWGKV